MYVHSYVYIYNAMSQPRIIQFHPFAMTNSDIHRPALAVGEHCHHGQYSSNMKMGAWKLKLAARVLNLSLRVPPLLLHVFSSCFGLHVHVQDTTCTCSLGHGPIFSCLPMKIFSNEPVLPILAHFGHFTGSPLGGGQVCRRIFKFSLNGCMVHGRMVLS